METEDIKIRTLIIDDEYPARKLLSEYVGKIPNLELVGVCEDGITAMAKLRNEDIDLVFSDIQMPDLSGLDLVKSIGKDKMVVFTTAYSEYALESYELNAIDYLLKPISFPRFMQAVTKATELFDMKKKLEFYQNSEVSKNDQAVISQSAPAQMEKNYMMIKADHKLYKVAYDDIVYIEGQSEYVSFHLVDGRKIIAYYSLKRLEEELPKTDFVRVHKSYIVSIHKIIAVEGVLINVANKRMTIGKNYKDNLLRVLLGRTDDEEVEESEE